MPASVRAHANLRLFLARRVIERYEQPADPYWGEHSDRLDRDHALFHLQIAYRCHLADLCEQKQVTLRPPTATVGLSELERSGQFIPEMSELAEKELHQDWLRLLVAEDFLPQDSPAVQRVDDESLIARAEGEALQSPASLHRVADELQSLFERHRDTQQEY